MHILSCQVELPGQFLGRRGAGALHPALNNSTDRFIPFREFLCANSVDRRTILSGWEDRANRGETFGSNPPGDRGGGGGCGRGALGGAPFHYIGRSAGLDQRGQEGRPVSSK